MPMGNVSYSAHISNGKSAITSKKALAGVAKHNLRKYKSADYSSDNIRLIYGTTDLFQDVKRVYHREFDDVVKEYNSRQKREDRKIKDYFEHVAGLNQDMAVEIIFQCGDKKYWDEHWKNKNYMSSSLSMPATGAIIQSVSQTKGAIGYVGLAYVSPRIKTLSVSYDGSHYATPSVENATNKTYPIVRPLYYYYNVKNKEAVTPLIQFILSPEGQEIIKKSGYIPIK